MSVREVQIGPCRLICGDCMEVLPTERRFIGIEKEPKYFDIACQRIQRAWDLKCSELPFEKPTPPRQLELI